MKGSLRVSCFVEQVQYDKAVSVVFPGTICVDVLNGLLLFLFPKPSCLRNNLVDVARVQTHRRSMSDTATQSSERNDLVVEEEESVVLKEIAEEVNCPLCLELLDDPRFLSCMFLH
jgi:hypothetical protein